MFPSWIIGAATFALIVFVSVLIIGKLYFRAKGYAYNLLWWGIGQSLIIISYGANKIWGKYPDTFSGYSIDICMFFLILLYMAAMSVYMAIGLWKGKLKIEFIPEAKYILPIASAILIVISFCFIFMTDILKY